MSDVDVAVIGAGPAGCAAAITCARAGLRVQVLERNRFPRDRPGETLHPGVEPLLRQLGVWERVLHAGFLQHKGCWITWGAERRFEAFGADEHGPWLGLQAWRADLDRILLEGVGEAGAMISQPERVVGVLVTSGRVTGVRTEHSVLKARYVVDASGRSHWLERELGLHRVIHSPRLIARYGYAEGVLPRQQTEPSITADCDGWTWIAQVKPDVVAWTRMNIGGFSPERDWQPIELNGMNPCGCSQGADVTWRSLDSPAGMGYLVAGDAAAVQDPASSHGVLKALMSGILAARRIVQSLYEGVEELDAAADYRQWVRSWFFHDVRRLTELYSIFPLFAVRDRMSRSGLDAGTASRNAETIQRTTD